MTDKIDRQTDKRRKAVSVSPAVPPRMRWFSTALCAAASSVALPALAAVSLQASSPSQPQPEVAAAFVDNASAVASLRRRCLASLAVAREQSGAPGLAACVSVRGRRLLSVGIGYADVENLTPCTPRSVMRIASISKSFASVLAAQLVETGRLDLDKPLAQYLTEPGMKRFASITPRQLLSHTSGVRSYRTRGEKELKDPEYYITKTYASVADAVQLFANDPLEFEPGSEMLYSTHGYTLLSAVLETAADGKKIESQFQALFHRLGISSGTSLEQHAELLAGRARQYQRDAKGRLVNAAFVNNSYKWAGGGLVSCAEDVTAFGEAVIRCAEGRDGLLLPSTIRTLWTPAPRTDGRYGLGWSLRSHRGHQVVSHSGGAIGGTSALILLPDCGVAICVVTNLEAAPAYAMASALLDAVIDFLSHDVQA